MVAFTAAELAEMAAADAQIEAEFQLSQDDFELSRYIDRAAALDAMDAHCRKVAERQKAYRAANREKLAEKQGVIFDRRKAAGLTQSSLANTLGVSQGLVSLWESGRAPANWDLLETVFPGIKKPPTMEQTS